MLVTDKCTLMCNVEYVSSYDTEMTKPVVYIFIPVYTTQRPWIGFVGLHNHEYLGAPNGTIPKPCHKISFEFLPISSTNCKNGKYVQP